MRDQCRGANFRLKMAKMREFVGKNGKLRGKNCGLELREILTDDIAPFNLRPLHNTTGDIAQNMVNRRSQLYRLLLHNLNQDALKTCYISISLFQVPVLSIKETHVRISQGVNHHV